MNDTTRARLLNDLSKCGRCGFCQAVCPIYREEGKEFSVARGKFILIEAALDGKIRLSRPIRDVVESCLVCKSCRAACPSGVRTDAIISAARELVAERYGLGARRRVALSLLRRPRLLTAAAWIAGRFWRLGFAPVNNGREQWRLRLPPGQVFPRPPRRSLINSLILGELAKRPTRDGNPVKVFVSKGKITISPLARQGAAVFFPGCLVNLVLPRVGLATVQLLLAMGIETVIPAAPVCCGMPHYVNGRRDQAVRLAKANLSWLASVDADRPRGRLPLVFSCPSCAEAWRGYPDLLSAEGDASAREMAARVYDISVFVAGHAPAGLFRKRASAAPTEVAQAEPIKLTYHDSCHLAQALGVRSEPRALLKQLPGISLGEMPDPGGCCGSGGTFGLFHPDLSRRIARRKVEMINATGARMVATGCPACLIQIGQGLAEAGRSEVVVRHTVELLAEALIGDSSGIQKVADPADVD